MKVVLISCRDLLIAGQWWQLLVEMLCGLKFIGGAMFQSFQSSSYCHFLMILCLWCAIGWNTSAHGAPSAPTNLRVVAGAISPTPTPTVVPSPKVRLISLQQRVLHNPDGSTANNYPSYVAQRAAYIDTLPFDGITVHCVSCWNIMSGSAISYTTISNEFLPLKGVSFNRMKYNFVKVPAEAIFQKP